MVTSYLQNLPVTRKKVFVSSAPESVPQFGFSGCLSDSEWPLGCSCSLLTDYSSAFQCEQEHKLQSNLLPRPFSSHRHTVIPRDHPLWRKE